LKTCNVLYFLDTYIFYYDKKNKEGNCKKRRKKSNQEVFFLWWPTAFMSLQWSLPYKV
jgi:hypothetical protein